MRGTLFVLDFPHGLKWAIDPPVDPYGDGYVHTAGGIRTDGLLYFDTGTTQQKVIKLRSNPHVVLTTGCNH
jgi:hypothetical protein